MDRIATVLALLKALGLASLRDLQSFRSITGQNFFLFVLLISYQQAASAEFFFVILVVIMLLSVSAGAMEKLPFERYASWPVSRLEWGIVRVESVAFNPIAWVAVAILVRVGWRLGLLTAAGAAFLQALLSLSTRLVRASLYSWLRWIPAPPGVTGSIMRLQWREMLATLDPYLALTLMLSTGLYRASGRLIDPAAPQVASLLVNLAISTETQVLFSMDGTGAERYRQLPLRGWQVLLAKDLAYLVMLSVPVLPLDFISGFASGLTVLAIGHLRSVLKPVPQVRWRFTSGSLFPTG